MSDYQVIGVIPARWASSRFPGKPLADLLGKSLIQRTYENAIDASSLDRVVVATDDRRIFDHVTDFGGLVVMSDQKCATGTDRVFEATAEHYPDAGIVVNIQGDEPSLDPSVIDRLVEKLEHIEGAVLTTPVAKITDPAQIDSPQTVKCVFDERGRALYFSRAPIPFSRDCEKRHDSYRHLGVYCFRRDFLETYCSFKPSPLQQIEDLEQLKVLEMGYPIHVCVVEDEGVGVDTPEDLERVKTQLCNRENTYSSPVV